MKLFQIFILLIIFSTSEQACFHEQLTFKDSSESVEIMIDSLDHYLDRLPINDHNYKGCDFAANKLVIISHVSSLDFFEEYPLGCETLQKVSYFSGYSHHEYERIYFLMQRLASNYITSADQRNGVWYHNYKVFDAVESPYDSQVVLSAHNTNLESVYKFYDVVATEGRLVLLRPR